MLVFLGRYKNKTEECVAIVSGKSLRLYEGPRCELKKLTEHLTEEAARAELEKLVARREKAGFRIHHRIEASPWLAWVDDLERLFERVLADARALKIPCDMRLGFSYFQRTWPAQRDPSLAKAVGVELAELPLVANGVRLQWVLGTADLSFRTQFHVSLDRKGSVTRLWTRIDNGREVAHGDVVKGGIEHHAIDGSIQKLKLASFAEWFPHHVRDDVMTFTLADLTPRV